MMIFFALSFIDILHPNNSVFSCFHLEEANLKEKSDLFKDFNPYNKTFSYNGQVFSYSCGCSVANKKSSHDLFCYAVSLLIFIQTVAFYPTFTPTEKDHKQNLENFKKEHVGTYPLFPLSSSTVIISDEPFEGDSLPVFIREDGKEDFYMNANYCRPNNPNSNNYFKEVEDFLNKNIPPCCIPHVQEGKQEKDPYKEAELEELLRFLDQS